MFRYGSDRYQPRSNRKANVISKGLTTEWVRTPYFVSYSFGLGWKYFGLV